MLIKDRDAGTRIKGGMPGKAEVRSTRATPVNNANHREYRDTPSAQKRFMGELEGKMKKGIPPLNRAGNK